MYVITRRRDGQRIAQFQVDPYSYSITKPGGRQIESVLDDAADLERMNVTEHDGTAAYDDEGATSMEGYQPATPEMRVSHIAQVLDAGYTVRERPPQMEAATRYSEGDKIETSDGTRGIVVEIRTTSFEGPGGGDVDASDDSPAYVIATQDGAEAVSASDIEASDWATDVSDPDKTLADDVAGGDDAEARLEAGPTDWDFPESWDESETPNRLILLDAWSSMGGQFDCGGGCCKGTMMSSGMSDRASDQFCASMKDRVLLWEGWRQGG